MFKVQATKNAHVIVPENCWVDVSRHRLLRRAVAGMEKARKSAQPGAWANNVRIIDERTGEEAPKEAVDELWWEMYGDE